MKTKVMDTLEAIDYLANDDQVAELARIYWAAASRADGEKATYLRVLVAHSIAAARKTRRLTSAQAQKIVDETHDRLYQLVLAAVTTSEVVADPKLPRDEQVRRSLERNRRSNFARTAKYAVDYYLAAGGKLTALVPAQVTKEALRSTARKHREGPQQLVGSVERAGKRLFKTVSALLEQDPTEAERLIKVLVGQLQELTAAEERPASTPARRPRKEVPAVPIH